MINRKKRVQVMFIMIMCKPCMSDPSLVKDMEPKRAKVCFIRVKYLCFASRPSTC